MSNTIIGRYDTLKRLGLDSKQAAKAAGITEENAHMLDAASMGPYDEYTLAAYGAMDHENSPYSPDQVGAALKASGAWVDPRDVHIPVKNHNPWYRKIFRGVADAAITVGETMAVPQQLMWQGLLDASGKDGDWREAIPDWAAPDEWKTQGIEHQILWFGDVLDEYIGGKYHAMLKDLDEKGGIAKYGAGWGLKIAEFAVDVVSDPANILAGAGLGKATTKALRKTLPLGMQAKAAVGAAYKSRSLVDYEEALTRQSKWVSELEAEAVAAPSEAVAKKLARAKTTAQEIEDEIAYLKTIEQSDGTLIELPPTRRTAKMDKPGKDATPEEKAAFKVQQDLEKTYNEPLRFEDLDNEALLRRLAFGPDDAEVIATALRRILEGQDPSSILVRGFLDNVSPTSTSLELAITGIGKNGMITREMAQSLDVMKDLAVRRGKGIETMLKTRVALKEAKKAALDAAKETTIESVVAASKTKVDDLTAKIKDINIKAQEAASGLREAKPLLRAEVTAAKKLLAAASKPVTIKINEAKEAAEAAVTYYRTGDAYKKLPKSQREVLDSLEAKRDKARQALVKERTRAGYYEKKTKAVLEDEKLVKATEKFKKADRDVRAAKKDYGIKDTKPPKPKREVVREVNEAAVKEAQERLAAAEAKLAAHGDPKATMEIAKKEMAALKGELDKAKEEFAAAKKGEIRLDVKDAADKRVKELEEELAYLDKISRAEAAELKHFKEYGEFSKNAQAVGIKAPGGPRRNIFEADDMDLNLNFGQKMMAKALYPGSWVPTLNWTIGSRMFREPMRVLESHLPGAWEIVRGGQKAKDAFIRGSYGKLQRIYEEAGVLQHQEAARKVKGTLNVDVPLKARVNKERDQQLYRLLDTDPTTPEFEHLWANADEKMRKAVTDVRAMLDEIAPRLGMAPSQYISGYIPHIAKKSWFLEGRFPPEFIGTRKIDGVPWFLKDREDFGQFIPSATEALDVYVRGVGKYLYTDPSMDMLQKMANAAARNPNKQWLSGYASDLIANVRGEPSVLSSTLSKLGFGQLEDGARKVAAAIGGLTYSAALTGNIRYPIMSIVQNLNTTAAEFGVLRTLKGMAEQMTPRGRMLARAAGLADEHLAHFEDLQGAWLGATSQLRFFAPSISDTESIIRGITFHASLDANMAKLGIKRLDDIKDSNVMRELVARASRDSDDINHIFGTFGKPVAFGRFSRTGSALATQFMSFPFKQTETIVTNSLKDPGFLVDYLIIAGQMQNIAGKANVDISQFIGVGYVDTGGRDLMSIPLDIISSGVMAFTSIFDPEMPSYERKQKMDKFKENVLMLGPLNRALYNTSSTLNELETGESRRQVLRPTATDGLYVGGDLKRKLNLSLTEKDELFNGGSEALAILTRLRSKQGKMQADADKQARLNSSERRVKIAGLVSMMEKRYREEGKIDEAKMQGLLRDLQGLGHKVDRAALMDMFENEWKAHYVIERLREPEPTKYDELRTVNDHIFYQGGR